MVIGPPPVLTVTKSSCSQVHKLSGSCSQAHILATLRIVVVEGHIVVFHREFRDSFLNVIFTIFQKEKFHMV